MASGRVMRKSPRNASPMNPATQSLSTPELESGKLKESTEAGEEWTEPPLRAPAPSFEDHKGLERQGVLEQMAPLGTMPNTKVKLRVKQYDPTRRAQAGKAADGATGAKDAVAALPVAGPNRRPDSRRADDRPGRQHSLREREEDKDYTPKAMTTKAPSSASSTRTSSTRLSQTSQPPNSRTSEGREALRGIVESTVMRAREIGNEPLGLAVQRLFEESLHKKSLAELLDAVLSRHPTPDQTIEFQLYIKVARKQIKMEQARASASASVAETASPTKPASKSPSKASRRSVSRNTGASNETAEPLNSTMSCKSHVNGKRAEPASKGDEQPTAKRVKCSRSVSSTSSLSSTHSAEFEPEPETEPEIANGDDLVPPPTGPKARGSLPRMHTFSTKQQAGTKRGSATAASASKEVNDEEEDDLTATELIAKRRKLSRKSWPDYKVTESNLREPPKLAARDVPYSLTSPALQTANLAHANGKEDSDGIRSPASSVLGDFLVPPPPGAMRASRSRGVTPGAKGRNVPRRGARIKTSPMKKKNGVIAGIARATRARDGSVGDHTDEGDGENVDYCTACGGNGELLCCDGCTRSFHFRCLDPPIDPSQPPDGEWYCYVCETKRGTRAKQQRGLLTGMERRLAKQNPIAYTLPESIRDYFDGVKTGEEGEFEEISMTKVRNNKLVPGYDEVHNDNFKLRDKEGQPVLCFRCGKSSLGQREIISCDFCSLKWHLDCLDPPLANPPRRDPQNRPKYSWMCPAHVDQDLLSAGRAGRTHKMRRPKNAKVVDTHLSRGFRNNGMIEIDNEDDKDDQPEPDEDGTVYRVTERSVKLDFIDRVKRANEEETRKRKAERRRQEVMAGQRVREDGERQVAFHARSMIEQQAALILAQLAGKDTEPKLPPGDVQTLINTLISEAPAKVVAMCTGFAEEPSTGAGGAPGATPTGGQSPRTASADEKQQLLLLQELIRRRLDDLAATEA